MDKREEKRKEEEEEEEKRKEERRKGKKRSQVWNVKFRKVWNLLSSVWKNIDFLYTSMKNMCVWKSSVFVWILVWNSMDLFSFGIESIDTWFGTLYLVYGLVLESPKPISC